MGSELTRWEGQRFGRLTVIRALAPKSRSRRVECRCDCGTVKACRVADLRSGSTQSCGCLQRERASKHGMWNHPDYAIWKTMVQRCRNPRHRSFRWYGARGINVCDRWAQSPSAFFRDMGRRPDRHTLDRIDNDGPYSPENCQWASLRAQSRNMRTNRWVDSYMGRLIVADVAGALGVDPSLIRQRMERGDCPTRVVLRPKGKRWIRVERGRPGRGAR